MIVRGAVRCATCSQLHVVRIGMGQETHQSHKFQCRTCKEQVGVALIVDYESISHEIVAEENAALATEERGVPIVNLDANFLIPESEQGQDFVFPRLTQAWSLVDKGKKVAAAAGVDLEKLKSNYRRPDFAAEWKLLRQSWSLQRNGKAAFSRARIKEASASLYSDEPLADLADWLWRFALKLNQRAYEPPFREAMLAIRPIIEDQRFKKLLAYYDGELAAKRGPRYFRIINEYFNGYSEFAQVQFLVLGELEIPPEYKASSTDFDRTSMFYGNAFETLADSVDLLAFLNNVLQGRPFDQFAELTLEKYYALDKSSRFNPFAGVPAFAALAAEANNQLRNASHHVGIQFDGDKQELHYRAGKGGQGAPQIMSYTEYLTRCVRIFEQILVLLRMELIFSSQYGVRVPL